MNAQLVRELNGKEKWGFTESQISAAEEAAHALAGCEGAHVKTAIVPYLDDLSSSFTAVWKMLHAVHAMSWRWTGFEFPHTSRLLPEVEKTCPTKVIRVELINMGAHLEVAGSQSPKVLRGERSAHLGILAVLALHPVYARAMGGEGTPNFWIPGMEVRIDHGEEWYSVPHCYSYAGKIGMGFYRSNQAHAGYAIPVIEESLIV